MIPGPSLRLIPVWLRVPAGIVAAAAALAIVLLIRSVPGQLVDLIGFIRLAGLSILYLCVGVLFGYVAVAGLPPAHLWRHAGYPWWPAQPEIALTPDLHRFLARLKDRHPSLRECWALEASVPGEWWFIASAESDALKVVRGDFEIRRKDVRLYLLDRTAQSVTPAWGRALAADFASWDWELQDDATAEFRCPLTGAVRIARRVWAW